MIELSSLQQSGLRKVGDLFVPGTEALPSFSERLVEEQVQKLVESQPRSDREEFLMLLSIFGMLPRFVIYVFMRLAEQDRMFPESIRPSLRMLSVGVKGVVYSVYYSDGTSDGQFHRSLGWDARIESEEEDLDPDQLRSVEAAEQALSIDDEKITKRAEQATRVTEASSDTIRNAYATVRHGREPVRKMSVSERCQYLERLKKIVLQRREWILDEIQIATGKSRTDALVSDVQPVLDHLRYLVANAEQILADKSVQTPVALFGKTSRVYYEPRGTVLVITPWNYPFLLSMLPVTSAFVTGNTVVHKPSEHAPMRGLMERLLEEAGFREEWYQAVYGAGETGARLIEQGPDMIHFTGSQRTGKIIMEQAAEQLIPVDLELGGKDPMIVFDDVNIERAASGAIWGGFTSAGQACMSVEKLYVQDEIYEEFREELLQRARMLTRGTEINQEGERDYYDVGNMTTDFQLETIRKHVRDAREKGAEELLGHEWDGESRSVPPMILEHITDDMLLAQEETFGPVLPLYRFSSEEDVIERVNDSEYGLSGSVWTGDLKRGERVSRAITTGSMVINNVMISTANPALPFGGTKSSGIGRYQGEDGLRSFCNIKSVMLEGDCSMIEANWYPYTEQKYVLFNQLINSLFSDDLLSFPKFVFTGLRLERQAIHDDQENR